MNSSKMLSWVMLILCMLQLLVLMALTIYFFRMGLTYISVLSQEHNFNQYRIILAMVFVAIYLFIEQVSFGLMQSILIM